MALLTIPGLATLFPCTGPMSRDNMIELGGLVGDAGTRHVLCDIEAAWSPDRIAETLDAWFLQRLMRSRASTLDFRYSHAWHSLVASGRVDVAAAASGVSTRQLERWFTRHIGQAPKTLVNIERLHASVRAVQMGGLDPIDGYSDQAHQIRSWRRYIGMTPGRYKMQQRSMMVQAFADGALTHFL
jgi:AraC-like DNA-binding protein